MFVVSQSATGQYVITHPPTNTVMVGDDLVSTWERMRTFADGLAGAAVPAPAAVPTKPRAPLSLVIAGVLVLLPFIWLGALHVSLGRLVAELRAPAADADDRKELRARIERLESSIAPPDVRPVKPAGPKKSAKPAEPEPADAAAKADPDDGDDAPDDEG